MVSSFAPTAFAITAVVPVEIPESKIMIRKNTGKDSEIAANAEVEILPPK